MKKKQTKKSTFNNTFSIVKGEALTNFGGTKRRFDNVLNEMPLEMTESARKVIDAYSDDDSISMQYDSDSNEVRISGKCIGGRIKLT